MDIFAFCKLQGGSVSATLQAAVVPIVNTETCKIGYGDSVADSMICAGYAEGGKDACQVSTLTFR